MFTLCVAGGTSGQTQHAFADAQRHIAHAIQTLGR
jgi:hypothetical protein